MALLPNLSGGNAAVERSEGLTERGEASLRGQDVMGRFEDLLRKSDSVSFDSLIGEAAILERGGRIYAVNEAWNRIGSGKWSVDTLAPGDDFLLVLRHAAVSGDDYAQSALLGVTSVLGEMIPSFSLRYPAATTHGTRWFELTATSIKGGFEGAVFVVIHESHNQEKVFGRRTEASYRASAELTQMATAVVELTGADCALISAGSGRADDECTVIARSARFHMENSPRHPREGSPCQETFSEGFVYCESGAQRSYPTARWLQVLGANGFADVVIQQPDGENLGHISVIHCGELHDSLSIEAGLRLFAARALGDLQQFQLELQLQRAEERMALTEAKYSALFQAVSDGIFLLDADLTILDANSGGEALLGRPAPTLIGTHANELIEFSSSVQDGFEDGRWRGSVTLERPDGQHVDVDVSVAPLEVQGKRNLVVVGREMAQTPETSPRSAVIRNEDQKNRAIAQTVPDPLLVVSRDGEVLERSSETGDWPAPDAGLRWVKDLLSGADVERCLAAIARSIDRAEVVLKEFELELGGSNRTFEWRIAPYQHDRVVVLIRDLGPRGEMGRDRRRNQNEMLLGHLETQDFRRNQYGLTFRELTILNLLASGTTDKDIAEHLCLSIYTVNKHVANILGKMQAASRTEAAVRGAREGLVA